MLLFTKEKVRCHAGHPHTKFDHLPIQLLPPAPNFIKLNTDDSAKRNLGFSWCWGDS